MVADQTRNPKRGLVEVVAIIPARGGQQSIPYKNLHKLGGKSLLAWAVEVGLAAETIDAVVVSTEDKRIAGAAQRLGAIVIPRPLEYAQPSSSDAGWYHHAVIWMEQEKGWQPELLVNLRPTSPLRWASDINAMVNYMKQNGEVDGVKSVVPAPLHPYKMWWLKIENRAKKLEKRERQQAVGGAGKLQPVFDNDYRKRHGPDQPRQIVQQRWPVYWQDGQIDITRRRFVLRPECLRYDNVWGENLHGYVLDPRTSTDLDTPDDFRRAAKLFRELEQERDKINKT